MCTDRQDAASVWYWYSAVKSKRGLRVLDYESRVVTLEQKLYASLQCFKFDSP